MSWKALRRVAAGEVEFVEMDTKGSVRVRVCSHLRDDACRKAVNGRVRAADHFGIIAELQNAHHRAKDFLACDLQMR